MNAPCAFCSIIAGESPASIVHEDEHTLSFMDCRQFNVGHVLVVPRVHLHDLRELSPPLGAALMTAVVQVTRAVDRAFPGDGISVWHSIGPAAFQEVPHLHIHVHPRVVGDGMLRIYPSEVPLPGAAALDHYAARVREQLRREC